MKLESVVRALLLRNGRRRLPVNLCVGAIIVVALVASLGSLALAAASFPDVPASHPNYAAITDLAERGIISGKTDGKFYPSDPVTRQQFAKMIVGTGEYPVSEANICPFGDVEVSGPGDLYPDNFVAVCAARGITLGKTETTFDPTGFITRYQVISMVVRTANDLQPGLLAAPPAGYGTWAGDLTHGANAAKAEYNDLLDGLDLAALNPLGNMTRGEVAQVLHNLLVKLGTSPGSTDTTATTEPGATFSLATSVSPAGGGTTSRSPDLSAYNAGATVMLTATPAAGYTFSGWSGDASGTTSPLTVTMDADKTIVANFSSSGATYTLTVTVPGGHGTVAKNPNKTSYTAAEAVTLTATPASGYVFHHWDGDATGSTNPLAVTMDANKTITAFFAPAPTYTLTINIVGGGSSTVTRSPSKTAYTAGESVTLTANPAAGYVFSYWSGDHIGSSTPATVVMNSNKTINATFRELNRYTLSLYKVEGGGSVVERDPARSQYYEDETVTLTAVPALGYEFSYWSGDLIGTSNPKSLVMDSNKSVYAHFTALAVRTLTITVYGSGYVSRVPSRTTLYDGESVTLTAHPASGWHFVRWWGSIASENNPATFTMNANKAVNVTFERD